MLSEASGVMASEAPDDDLPQNFRDVTRAVGERVRRPAELIRDRHKQVRHRDIVSEVQMRPMPESQILSAAENHGVVNRAMRLAGRTTIEPESVVQQSAFPFLDSVESLEEAGMHLV